MVAASATGIAGDEACSSDKLSGVNDAEEGVDAGVLTTTISSVAALKSSFEVEMAADAIPAAAMVATAKVFLNMKTPPDFFKSSLHVRFC